MIEPQITIDMTEAVNEVIELAKPWRFVYLETPGAVTVLAEDDIKNVDIRMQLATVKTNSCFAFKDDTGRGFVVEADACDPIDIASRITYHLQEFREIYPQKL
jgi:hypothetical protein